ncbi:MAG: NADPH-dependent FMN reductase [Ancrocorticia sp.]|uniref:NADPH-dependent FMN reductase n=1 Tax=Ancrocorticia sp. TaxID=2593684 RepID=UPI003F90E56F
MKIGIVIGSIREGRSGEKVAQWLYNIAKERTDVEFSLIDLKEFNVPLLTSPVVPGAAQRQYDDPNVTAWGKEIDSYDGFIFVTPEYNHSIPGGMKNAVDSIGPEWNGKTVAFVSYGADGGVRATEHWRQIVANFQMFAVRASVAIYLFNEFDGGEFKPLSRREGEANGMIDQLIEATGRTLS